MYTPFNSFPYRPNQVQADGTTTASAPQQGTPSNHCQGNLNNFYPNSSNIQSQMGMNNPQIAFPFNNSSTHLGMPISGAPNHSLPMQNGMPFLGSANVMSHHGQLHGGFGPQNLNSMPIAPMNVIQPPGQFLAHNPGSQNAVFPNVQLCFQSPMPNANQFVQMPMPTYNQLAPCNMHMYSNQASQAMAAQNPAFFGNSQFGLLHSNAVVQPGNQDQHKLVLSTVGGNATGQSQNTSQQSQGNSPLPPIFGSVPPQQTQKDFHPPVSTQPLENLRKDGGNNNWNSNWKNSQNRNFTKNQRRDEPRRGFPKSHFPNMQNSNGKFRLHNKYGGKGYKNDGARTCEFANPTNQTPVKERRPLPLNYTEQEIQQWREERRKNYPSTSNLEKKAEKLTGPEVIDRDAKLRRQQLKDVLAKQAELGCEVAEIPSCYLSRSEKQVHNTEIDKRALTKKEKFQNKFNKRGRFRQNERFTKKQRSTENVDSPTLPNQEERFSEKQKLTENDSRTKSCFDKKQPTLLQKLLSVDIRRDKRHLLQVFRFMVLNSFFKDWPEKPLEFPLVVVKESASEGGVVEEKSLDKTAIGGSKVGDYPGDGGADDEDDNIDNDKHVVRNKAVGFASLKGSKGGEVEKHEEEEGEIID